MRVDVRFAMQFLFCIVSAKRSFRSINFCNFVAVVREVLAAVLFCASRLVVCILSNSYTAGRVLQHFSGFIFSFENTLSA